MQSNPIDARLALLSNIDVASCRIEFAEAPLVLLCGGKVPIKDTPNAPNPPTASMRHAITLADVPYEIFRPEEIPHWLNDGIYKNLMELEADLASICSMVVIILESAGSLVELGAFSQLPDLSKKIIVVKSSDFVDAPSFINLGILRHISESHQSGVKSYPWQIQNPSSITTEVVDDVISDIRDELSKLGKSQLLKPKQESHAIVFICEIIKLFVALKEHEILEYLIIIGASITKDQLKSKLFLLEQFRLIRREEYSDSIFYMRSTATYHKLRLGLKKTDLAADLLRIEMECLEYYQNDPKHRHRVRAIAQAKKGLRQ
jgi:hypothetical protein